MKVAVVIEMVMLEVFDTEITKMEADNVTHVPQGWVSSSFSKNQNDLKDPQCPPEMAKYGQNGHLWHGGHHIYNHFHFTFPFSTLILYFLEYQICISIKK